MWWVLAGVVIVLLFVLSHVDDWSRDFTTNVASTAEPGGKLQPLRVPLAPIETANRVRRVVESMPRWTLAPESGPGVDQAVTLGPKNTEFSGTDVEIHLIRTTPIMRFKDDIYVRLAPGEAEGTTTIHVRSQSRLGRGDLGQNPRNIRELLQRLSHALP